jgi:hypothetical protein
MNRFGIPRLVSSSFALSLLVLAAPARGQDNGPPQDLGSSEAVYLAKGVFHRAILPSDSPVITDLMIRNAIVWAEDYGSFTLLYVDARRGGGVHNLIERGVQIADALTLADFNGYRLDGADPAAAAAVVETIPDILRAPSAPPVEGESRLKLVQFVGPVKDAWLDALRATGAYVVTYAAQDAYVVKALPAGIAAIDSLSQNPYVLSVADYQPAFKLRPELRPPFLIETQAYDVTVQVIGDDEGAAFAESLRARAIAVVSEPDHVLGYINFGLRLDGANVIDLARDPHVFAVEPILEARLLDERQGQIMAGNLDGTGTQPSGPNYFSWLSALGFPGTDPFNFVVDIEDDGVDRGSTTDVNTEFKVDGLSTGASRVVYVNWSFFTRARQWAFGDESLQDARDFVNFTDEEAREVRGVRYKVAKCTRSGCCFFQPPHSRKFRIYDPVLQVGPTVMVKLADAPFIYQLLCEHHRRGPAIVVTEHVNAFVGADCIKHALCFGDCIGQRFFAQDSLLSVSRGDRDWHMQFAGSADVNHVNVLALDDLFP